MWKYILIGIGLLILVGGSVYLYRNYTGKNSKINSITPPGIPDLYESLSQTDKIVYGNMSKSLIQYMDCAEDGGTSSRCPPNWRDGGKTRDTISPETIARYSEQLATTEYSNDTIRKVAGRNLIYQWRYQLKAKSNGTLVSVPVYEALFEAVNANAL